MIVDGQNLFLLPDEYELVVDVPFDDDVAIAMMPSGGFVVLDTAVTPELAAEGLARDVVRAVQQARKDAGLEVTDRIRLSLAGDADAVAAIRAHRELIAGETLATDLAVGEAEGGVVPVGEGSVVTIEVSRA